jgi:histidinol phosphatase-like enzyme (inositol monophosphatase family)
MKELLEFATRIAWEAGESTLSHFLAPDLGVETKQDGSPVTRADRAAEELLRRRIRAECPQDAILGEEFGEEEGGSGRTWILDPIDGTKSFARGVPLYGTLVAVEEQGRAVVGVIHMPAIGETACGARGEGAWWIRRSGADERRDPARVSAVSDPALGLLCTTSVGGFFRAGCGELYYRLRERFGLDRGWSDCYGHLLVATGRAEAMLDPRMEVWDCAALQPVVEEAGGRFTTLSGEATHRGGSAVSTNGALHDHVLSLVD